MWIKAFVRFLALAGAVFTTTILLGGCSGQPGGGGTTTVKLPKFVEALYEAADPVLGGNIYDKWWAKGAAPPGFSNPMIKASGSTNVRNGDDWRCSSCHGWNYADSEIAPIRTGSMASMLADKTPKQVFEFILNGTAVIDGQNKQHQFYKLLEVQQVYELTAFLTKEELRVDNLGNGDKELGRIKYTTFNYVADGHKGCEASACHRIVANRNALLLVAAEQPAKFIHKVRFGNAHTSMPGGPTLIDAKNILAYAKTLKAGTVTDPGITTGTFSEALYNDATKIVGDLVRGGLLYDKWWEATSPPKAAPASRHPLWPVNANSEVTLPSTWRCSKCHGWDYRGADGVFKDGSNFSGIRGIIPTNSTAVKFTTAADVFNYIKTGSNHAFGKLLSDIDIYGLTRFVMSQRDLHRADKAPFHFIDDISGTTIGTSITNGSTLFGPTCGTGSGCHNLDGKGIDFADGAKGTGEDEFVDTVANVNPWEFMHKVLYGQPGSSPSMPTLITSVADLGTTVAKAADILAHAQVGLVPNIKRGGRLYDKWWKEANAPPPTTDQVRWATRSKTGTVFDNARSGADSWRCKECHGWDYKGKDGAYGLGDHKTGFPGILTRTRTTKILVEDFIRSGTNHAFAGTNLLTERDVKDLAAFVVDNVDGVIDVTNGLAATNTTAGQTLYTELTPGNCKECHGANGKQNAANIALLATVNPPEFIHKARFGDPGSTMIPAAGKFAGLSLLEAGNTRAYAATLPALTTSVSLTRGGRLFDNWWEQAGKDDPAVKEPTAANPMWATRDTSVPNVPAGSPISTTWRCVTCHDWNYRGVGFLRAAGSVISKDNLVSLRARYLDTGFFANDDELAVYLFTWIKLGRGGQHSFGVAQAGIVKPLVDADVWDLAYFLTYGIIDTTTYISNLGGIVTADMPASILNGGAIYSGAKHTSVNCASCHGADGVTSPPGTTAKLDILDVAKNEATEFFHKARFGQPGTNMPPMLDVQGIPDFVTANKEARDVLAYTQDLFCQRVPKPAGC